MLYDKMLRKSTAGLLEVPDYCTARLLSAYSIFKFKKITNYPF